MCMRTALYASDLASQLHLCLALLVYRFCDFDLVSYPIYSRNSNEVVLLVPGALNWLCDSLHLGLCCRLRLSELLHSGDTHIDSRILEHSYTSME